VDLVWHLGSGVRHVEKEPGMTDLEVAWERGDRCHTSADLLVPKHLGVPLVCHGPLFQAIRLDLSCTS
jgi:hypothetical protein